jgi:protein-disulfide isomerase
MPRLRRLVISWICFAMSIAVAQAAGVLKYEGRMNVDGVPFTGAGQFAFLIQDGNGAILWASGDIPFQGKTNIPAGTIKLPVREGVYDIRLGDTTTGMPALDANLLMQASSPRLQVWFNDGKRGWQTAGEDVALSGSLAAARQAPVSNDAVLREVRELRALVERLQSNQRAPAQAQPQAPSIATVSFGDSPVVGQADAPLVLVEFTDYQCPFCKRFDDDTFAQLKKNYVETGKLRIVSRNLPLSFHDHAGSAAEAALCAQQQQQYWPMREKLFANAQFLTVTNLMKAAEELKLNVEAFRSCLEKKTFASQVKQDGQDAGSAGITGTPSFVVGRVSKDGKVTGTVLVGALPYATFDSELQKLLSAK